MRRGFDGLRRGQSTTRTVRRSKFTNVYSIAMKEAWRYRIAPRTVCDGGMNFSTNLVSECYAAVRDWSRDLGNLRNLHSYLGELSRSGARAKVSGANQDALVWCPADKFRWWSVFDSANAQELQRAP
jgi:hypothetical protein